MMMKINKDILELLLWNIFSGGYYDPKNKFMFSGPCLDRVRYLLKRNHIHFNEEYINRTSLRLYVYNKQLKQLCDNNIILGKNGSKCWQKIFESDPSLTFNVFFAAKAKIIYIHDKDRYRFQCAVYVRAPEEQEVFLKISELFDENLKWRIQYKKTREVFCNTLRIQKTSDILKNIDLYNYKHRSVRDFLSPIWEMDNEKAQFTHGKLYRRSECGI